MVNYIVRVLARILIIGTLAGGVAALAICLKRLPHFPVKTVEIQGDLKYLNFTDVQKVIEPYMKRDFFRLNVHAIQKSVQGLPWVAQASVQRIWPDRLKISLSEKVPQAIWNEKGILSTDNQIFYPELQSLPSHLPHFNGPESKAGEMQHYYFSFLEMLKPLGLSIAELNISPDGSWRILLDNGIALIMGRAALNERVGRFAQTYPKSIAEKREKIAYLDLRYTNGFAIGWKALNSE